MPPHDDLHDLEREYDNRAKVPAALLQDYRARWAAGSNHARNTCELARHIPYGPTALERLDIYGHKTAVAKPVHVYIHGGYWHFGDKHDSAYVALAFEAECITVVLNYGLAPEVHIRDQVSQCRRALAWVRRHIADYGGDPSQIVLTGHSAGAHLAAMMLATDWRGVDDALPAQIIGAAALFSGIYELSPIARLSINEQLRLAHEDIAPLSPVNLKCQGTPRLLVGVGDLEGREFILQSRNFAQRWGLAGASVQFALFDGTDHFSIRSGWEQPENAAAALLRSHYLSRGSLFVHQKEFPGAKHAGDI